MSSVQRFALKWALPVFLTCTAAAACSDSNPSQHGEIDVDGGVDGGDTEDMDGGLDAGGDSAYADGGLDGGDREDMDGGLDGGDSAPDGSSPDGADAGDSGSGSDGDVDAGLDSGPEGGDAGTSADGGDAEIDAGPTCSDCGTGLCLADGSCIACTAQVPCQNANLVCNVATGSCVECLPSDDHCPDGEYCSAGFQCLRGCKGDANCASGRCNEDHACERCLSDLECGAGQVCGTLSCGTSCDDPGDAGTSACAGSLECCTAACVDTTRDIAHCGGCGMACSASQFCGTAGCADVSLANLCDNQAATLITTGAPDDVLRSEQIKTALGDLCTPAPTLDSHDVSESALLNLASGQPVAGGNHLLVTVGSAYSNPLVDYLEQQGIAPLLMTHQWDEIPSFEFRRSSDNSLIYGGQVSDETETDAHFVIALARDSSGSVTLYTYGYWSQGTGAGAWYLINQVLNTPASYGEAWYVYRWQSINANLGPDAEDTFTLIASGS